MKTAQGVPSAGKRASVKLTDAVVRSLELPAGKSDYTYFDSEVPGFGVRCRATGSKRFVFVYSHGKRVPIGVTTALPVTKARQIAAGYYAQVRAGADPAGDRAQAKDKAADTFIALARRYLQFQKQELRPGSYRNGEHHLLVHAAPLHNKPLHQIERRDIASCLGGLDLNSNRIGNGAATKKNVRASISGLFRWGMGEGLCEANPTIGVTSYQVRPRERVLSLDELRAIWLALPDDDFGRIIKLLALTGQRQMEIAGLHRSELQGDGIALPEARTKNNRAHFVPMPPAAWAIIEEQLRQQDPTRDYIFGRRGPGPFANWGKSKKQLDAAIAARGKPLPHWTIHDLRRSAVTHMNEIGIAPHIVEAIVNHQSGFRAGVASTYNKARYEPEKRTALARWAEYLLGVIEGRDSNVTALRRGA
jgi:integrase